MAVWRLILAPSDIHLSHVILLRHIANLRSRIGTPVTPRASMTILFLHGWHSVPGGPKPSCVSQHSGVFCASSRHFTHAPVGSRGHGRPCRRLIRATRTSRRPTSRRLGCTSGNDRARVGHDKIRERRTPDSAAVEPPSTGRNRILPPIRNFNPVGTYGAAEFFDPTLQAATSSAKGPRGYGPF